MFFETKIAYIRRWNSFDKNNIVIMIHDVHSCTIVYFLVLYRRKQIFDILSVLSIKYCFDFFYTAHL